MPVIAPKSVEPSSLRMRIGPAVGKVDDFWALAYCPEADETEREIQPEHTEFTYVLRYHLPQRTLVGRVPRRIDGLWQRRDGSLMAVGDVQGYLEIDARGIREVALSDVPGVFRSVWGADDQHVFACGVGPGFVLYREDGAWSRLPLPEGAKDVRDVGGLSPADVYFVGEEGEVLHYDGKRVARLRVPVRRHLNAVARLDATRVCIGGYSGTLLVGNAGGWRHLVTNVSDPLLSIAALDGLVYYGADEKVWSSDGAMPPEIAVDFPARWVSGLQDGLVLSHELEAALYAGGTLTPLDVAL